MRLSKKQIETNFRFAENSQKQLKLIHNTGNSIKLLPYKAKYNKNKLQSFEVIIGEFSRLIYGTSIKEDCNHKDLVDKIVEKVRYSDDSQVTDRINFKEIIKEIFFTKEDKLIIFHPRILNYIETNNNEEKSLANFLYSILYSSEMDNDLLKTFNSKSANVLSNLVLDSLPELETVKPHKEIYKNVVPFVSEVFKEDFTYLLKDSAKFIENFERMLKFYYFFYVSQLSLKISRMFEVDLSQPEEIYFYLSWEKTSKSRSSYGHGWDNLVKSIEGIFSHVNCLEFLNCHNEAEKFLYHDIKERISTMDDSEKVAYICDLEWLITTYKSFVGDVDWSKFKCTARYPDQELENIRILQAAIDYQFKHSARDKPYHDYSKWFIEFCKRYWLKQRGTLGYTLNMTQDDLIFITKLCIKDKEKIRLKKLFEEYERRGVYFDRFSKEQIIQLFEKQNLIEKKSDSGDAQYVRSIL